MRFLRLLLPDLAAVPGRSRGIVAAAGGVLVAMLAANLAQTQFGLGGEALEKPLNAWGQNVVLACACVIVAVRVFNGGPPGSRALLAAITLWTLGNLWWGFVLYGMAEPPYPSAADVGWLAFYPCAYLCLGLHLRGSARDLPRSAWLDGLIGILSVGALGTALVVAPVLFGADGTRAAVLTNAAYPLADLLLLALTVAVLVLHGWRAGRAWALLGAGFGLFALADSIYLSRLASDTYSAGTGLDSMWVVALVIMALASWQPLERPRAIDPGRRGVLIPPFLFAGASLALLVGAGLERVPAVAVALAAAAVLVTLARSALTVREIRGFHEVRHQAATDELTELPNRREFGRRLQTSLAHAHQSGEPLALLIIDLDRFKELNDALGHHAGDAVLAQIGPRLRAVLRTDDVLVAIALEREPEVRRIDRQRLDPGQCGFVRGPADERVLRAEPGERGVHRAIVGLLDHAARADAHREQVKAGAAVAGVDHRCEGDRHRGSGAECMAMSPWAGSRAAPEAGQPPRPGLAGDSVRSLREPAPCTPRGGDRWSYRRSSASRNGSSPTKRCSRRRRRPPGPATRWPPSGAGSR